MMCWNLPQRTRAPPIPFPLPDAASATARWNLSERPSAHPPPLYPLVARRFTALPGSAFSSLAIPISGDLLVPRLLSPKLAAKGCDLITLGFAPTDERQRLLADGLRLCQSSIVNS